MEEMKHFVYLGHIVVDNGKCKIKINKGIEIITYSSQRKWKEITHTNICNITEEKSI